MRRTKFQSENVVPLREVGPLKPSRPGEPSVSFGFDPDENVGIIRDVDGHIERIEYNRIGVDKAEEVQG